MIENLSALWLIRNDKLPIRFCAQNQIKKYFGFYKTLQAKN